MQRLTTWRLLSRGMLVAPRCAPEHIRSRLVHASRLTVRPPATIVVKGRAADSSGRGCGWPLRAAADGVLTQQRPDVQSFAELGLSPGLQAAMSQHELLQPTEIQVCAALVGWPPRTAPAHGCLGV